MVPNHDRIESILMAALEIESDIDRRAYLRQTCGDDTELRLQVEQLISNHFQAGSFLNVPGQTLPKFDKRCRPTMHTNWTLQAIAEDR